VWYDANFLCASVLPDIGRNLCDGKRKKTLRAVDIHVDNALAHNAERSQQEIARVKAIRVVHSVYFPDAALSDFILFGSMTSQVEGFRGHSPAEIPSEIRRISQKISKDTLMAVYDEWITRLE
jgi:hypothetical protein